jgi:hypothetical protein
MRIASQNPDQEHVLVSALQHQPRAVQGLHSDNDGDWIHPHWALAVVKA